MKKLAPTVIALSFVAPPASVALSGFYDSREQISTILSSEAVANTLRQAPVGSVSNTGTREDGTRQWEVRTQACDLKVYFVPNAPAGVGKTTYTVDIEGACE